MCVLLVIVCVMLYGLLSCVSVFLCACFKRVCVVCFCVILWCCMVWVCLCCWLCLNSGVDQYVCVLVCEVLCVAVCWLCVYVIRYVRVCFVVMYGLLLFACFGLCVFAVSCVLRKRVCVFCWCLNV